MKRLRLFFILWFCFAITFSVQAVTTTLVKVTVTYPQTNTSLWMEQGMLINDQNGLVTRFTLKDSWNSTVCIEQKSLPIINGTLTYQLGSQFSINSLWVQTWCNMDSLAQKSSYTVQVQIDLDKNGSFSDSLDYSNSGIEYRTDSNPEFQSSYMDSSSFDTAKKILNGISVGSGSNTANIEYNLKAWEFSTAMMSQGYKTKTFDFNKDWIVEVIAKPVSSAWVVYFANTSNGSFENIFTHDDITLDDNTNVFVNYKWGNFLLYANSFGINPADIKSNFSWVSYSIKNGIVITSNLEIKSFRYGNYVTITLWGNDITFDYNSISRQYEQQLSVELWSESWLYDSVTSSLWTGTPFSSDAVDYYDSSKELEINGTVVSNIDWSLYWDFNKDNKLDFLTYTKIPNSDKVKITIYLKNDDWTYKKILDNYQWDTVNIGNSILDNSSDFWVDIPEISITSWDTTTFFRINKSRKTNVTWIWNTSTVSQIASFDATFYYLLWTSKSVSASFVKIDSYFKDMETSHSNDKYLVTGKFKNNRFGYDYYDYSIKRFDGTSFVDIVQDGYSTAFKKSWNKIGFRKIWNSAFYAFYIDQSSQYTNNQQDLTNLYYIYNWKVASIMPDVIVNDRNTLSSQDWNNEWGEKLLSQVQFWLLWINLDNVKTWTLWIKKSKFISYDYPKSCYEWYNRWMRTHWWATISINGRDLKTVWCDMNFDWWGWTRGASFGNSSIQTWYHPIQTNANQHVKATEMYLRDYGTTYVNPYGPYVAWPIQWIDAWKMAIVLNDWFMLVPYTNHPTPTYDATSRITLTTPRTWDCSKPWSCWAYIKYSIPDGKTVIWVQEEESYLESKWLVSWRAWDNSWKMDCDMAVREWRPNNSFTWEPQAMGQQDVDDYLYFAIWSNWKLVNNYMTGRWYIQDIFKKYNDFSTGVPVYLSLDSRFSTTWLDRGMVYDQIKSISWGIGYPRSTNWNNTKFWIANNAWLWSRDSIDNYLSRNDFITKTWLRFLYRSPNEVWVFGTIKMIQVANLWTDKNKHTVNNLRDPINTTLWWSLYNDYLYEDETFGKMIYFDNWGLGTYVDWWKNLMSQNWGRWLFYLDQWNYGWFGSRKLVLWDKTWSTITSNGYNYWANINTVERADSTTTIFWNKTIPSSPDDWYDRYAIYNAKDYPNEPQKSALKEYKWYISTRCITDPSYSYTNDNWWWYSTYFEYIWWNTGNSWGSKRPNSWTRNMPWYSVAVTPTDPYNTTLYRCNWDKVILEYFPLF